MLKVFALAVALLFPVAALAQEFKVSGSVVREDKQEPDRVPDADRVLLRGSGPSKIIDIDAGGTFEFTGVRPGSYQIVVGPRVTMDPIAVVVTDKDVAGLRILVPDVVTLRGTIAVEGGGPLPRFQLAFTRVDAAAADALPINVTGASFTTPLHSGQYRITSSGLPRGFTLKSATLAAADVLSQSMKVAPGESEPLTLTLGVSSPPPWVKVSGRVSSSGMLPVTGLLLSGTVGADVLTAAVTPDGVFEFPQVLPGSYTTISLPLSAVSGSASVTAGTTDVTNLQIRIPPPIEVRGRIVLRGNIPMPRVGFLITAAPGVGGTAASLPANPQPDGSFTITLAEGERQITAIPGTIPSGYKVASFTYGTTDLLKDPIRIPSAGKAEIRLTFDTSAVTPVNVSGRVTGLLTSEGVRVVLMSQVLPSVEAPVSADGSFKFANVIPGNYIARLSLSGSSTGVQITVRNQDLTDVVIAYPREFTVTGHILLEDGAGVALPDVVLEAKSAVGAVRTSNIINNGVIALNVKDGEYNVSIRSMSAGYQLKSIMYGTTDLQKAPLKIDGPVTWEIIVRVGKTTKS